MTPKNNVLFFDYTDIYLKSTLNDLVAIRGSERTICFEGYK